MRHDAAKSREQQRSEQIRQNLGIMYPEEKAAFRAMLKQRLDEKARETQLGVPLFSEFLESEP